jgi:hypothetical protein
MYGYYVFLEEKKKKKKKKKNRSERLSGYLSKFELKYVEIKLLYVTVVISVSLKIRLSRTYLK